MENVYFQSFLQTFDLLKNTQDFIVFSDTLFD